jgi:hypothetical protein
MSDDAIYRSLVAAAFLVLVLSLLFFPAFLAGLWERRLVWPYVPADEYDGQPPPLTKWSGAANDTLAARGFTRVDTLFDGRGRGYRFRYDFWLSADGVVLAIVGGGRLFGGRSDSVWLRSRLADDRALRTVNTLSGAEPDLSGMWQDEVAEGAGLDEQLARHVERARDCGGVVPYPADDPLAVQAESFRQRVALLVAHGSASYVDDEETAWRYSVKGAALLVMKINVMMMTAFIRSCRQKR